MFDRVLNALMPWPTDDLKNPNGVLIFFVQKPVLKLFTKILKAQKSSYFLSFEQIALF